MVVLVLRQGGEGHVRRRHPALHFGPGGSSGDKLEAGGILDPSLLETVTPRLRCTCGCLGCQQPVNPPPNIDGLLLLIPTEGPESWYHELGMICRGRLTGQERGREGVPGGMAVAAWITEEMNRRSILSTISACI